MIMLTHVMAASVPGNMCVMDSGAEEHDSREINIFTDMPVATFTSTYMCIVPDDSKRVRLRRNTISVGDKINTLRFLARST